MRRDANQSAFFGSGLTVRGSSNRAVVLGATIVGVVGYLVATLACRWLPAGALWVALGLLVVALGIAWPRLRPGRTGSLAALGLPLHIALIGTGGLTSPLAPALSVWLFSLTRHWPRRAIVVFGIGAMLWVDIVEGIWGRLAGPGFLEGSLIFAAGLLPAIVLGGATRRSRPAAGGQEPAAHVAFGTDSGVGDVASPVQRAEELIAALDRVRARLGGSRAVLWEVDVAAGEARPGLVSGAARPPAVSLAGDPLGLALEEGMILRLDTPPRWAAESARAVVVPLERYGAYTALLTVEYPDGTVFPAIPELEDVSSLLRALLDLQREAELARQARERFGRVVSLLGRLSQQLEVMEFATQLAQAARDFMGVSGAAVARWDQDAGHVMALVGDDGGAAPGTVFTLEESELALAVANGAPLVRQRQRGARGSLPILAPGERWYAEPRWLLILPLDNPATGVVGALVLWNTEEITVDEEQIEILKLVVPYAALILHQLQLYHPLQEFAERDALTGLYNRRVFEERLAAEDARFLRYGRNTSLLILDIDHFKSINDTHGHEAGDAALKAVARVVRAAIRETDMAARLGGEEFVVLLPETPLAGALEIAERLRRRVEELTVEWEGIPIAVRVSIGVASAPECAESPAHLPAIADAALYASKRGGRNRVTAAPYAVAGQ